MPTSAKRPVRPSTSSSRTWILWGSLVAVVVAAAIIAVVATSGADGDGGGGGQAVPVTVTGTPLPVLADSGQDPAVGQTIPTASGQTFDGERLTIGPDGTPKVILFVAHWCPHCQREVPFLVDHLATNPLPDDVDLVTVSTQENPDAGNYPPEEWLDREGWTFPVLKDDDQGAVAQAFGLSAFPYFVAVDADGKVVARTTGELSAEQFDALVAAAGSAA